MVAKNRIAPKQVIENKELNFWRWLKKSNVRMDEKDDVASKLIPGAATALAILVFLAQVFITYIVEHDGMHDYYPSLVLNVINALILVFILYKGFGEKNNVNVSNIDFGSFAKANIEFYTKLEKQFISCVRGFFFATLILYAILLVKNFSTDVRAELLKKHPLTNLSNIYKGDSLIRNGVSKLDLYYRDSTKYFYTSVQLIPAISKVEKILLSAVEKQQNPSKFNDGAKCEVNLLSERIGILGHAIDTLSARIKDTNALVQQCLFNIQKGYWLMHNSTKAFQEKDYVSVIIGTTMLLVSNIGAVFLIAAFLVLYSKTLNEQKSDKSYIYFGYVISDPHGKTECEDYPTDKNDIVSKRIMRIALMFCTMLTLASLAIIPLDNYKNYFSLLEFCSGLFNAVAMCLLFARFESTYFQPTLSVLIVLYIYAIIQSFLAFLSMPFLETDRSIEYFTKLVAFICKCILYLYILWIYRTDRLLFYFYHKENVKGTKMDWDIFLTKLHSRSVR